MKVVLSLCLLLFGVHISGCSKAVQENNAGTSGMKAAENASLNSEMPPRNTPSPSIERSSSNPRDIVLFDGKNYIKKSGQKTPSRNDTYIDKNYDRGDVERGTKRGKQVKTKTTLYGYRTPWLYSQDFFYESRNLDYLKGKLESLSFRKMSVNGKVGVCQCPKNSDGLYDRQKMLEKFDDILKTSIPAYAKFPLDGFFIYDLTQSSNKYISTQDGNSENCINFIDNRIYHFSLMDLRFSRSHIGFLRDGKLKVFESVNCEHNNDNLKKVVSYANEWLKNDENKDEILIRLKNYRRYGFYFTIDDYRVSCNYDKEIPENSDKLYDRWKVLNQLSNVLRTSVSERVKDQLSWRFLTEESRASGFFVWDLTEPSNKQTSLLERVEFKNNHVYHFAFIDAPFSFSNIAILEDGKLKFFRTINCKSKGDSLEDIITYLNEKLKNDKSKDKIIKRVKNYREYGVYASFNGQSTPQCEEVVKTEK